MGFSPTVFEVFTLPDGWYVFCHGGVVGDGKTVQIDRAWNVGRATDGPPPAEVLKSASKSNRE